MILINDKVKKLLEYSVILSTSDKKNWLDLLHKMSEKQVQVLYSVLIDEVHSWKKEGISIIPDLALEKQLLPEEKVIQHGASINNLKAMLQAQTGDKLKQQPSNNSFAKELKREVETPELVRHVEAKAPTAQHMPVSAPHMPAPVPHTPAPAAPVIKPKPLAVPKVRNRIAKHGLRALADIKEIDDIGKVEAAHLRQGPLLEQIGMIKRKITELADHNDVLPVSIIPTFEKSPLYVTYLKAGAMLIDKNSGAEKVVLDEIMEELEANGMDSLTQQEFEAIADMKKDLDVMAGI